MKSLIAVLVLATASSAQALPASLVSCVDASRRQVVQVLVDQNARLGRLLMTVEVGGRRLTEEAKLQGRPTVGRNAPSVWVSKSFALRIYRSTTAVRKGEIYDLKNDRAISESLNCVVRD